MPKTKATLHWNPFLLSFLFTAFILVASAEGDCSSKSFSFELVHRHDPRLPGNENLKLNKYESIKDRALRDVARRNRRKDAEIMQMPIRSGWDYQASEYFVQVRVGTPSQKFWLIADTGSDLTWIRCNDDRYETELPTQTSEVRDESKRGFYRRLSSTYQKVTCGDPRCKSDEFISMAADPHCVAPFDLCRYAFRYVSGTVAYGFFGTDTVTLGLTNRENKGTVKDLVVGCTKEMDAQHDGVFKNADGVLGLSYTPNSFMYKATKQYGNKFSYCLMDHTLHKNESNFLTFGSYETTQTPNASLLAPMKRTELVPARAGAYGVKVEGISVGDQMLPIPPEFWDFETGEGLVLDSGTSLSFLGGPAFQMVSEALWKPLATKYKRTTEQTDPFTYCFVAGDGDGGFQNDVPKLAFHFAGGVVFEPPPDNYVVPYAPNVQCIAIAELSGPNGERVPGGLLGNIMQQNHLWEFDLDKNTVGFAPSNCI